MVIFILLLPGVLLLPPYYMIIKKAGFSGWLCLSMFIPPINLLVLYYIAFSEWPIHKDNLMTTVDKNPDDV